MCDECGKHGYTSKEQAKIISRQLHPGEQLRVYKCGPWWHLTSQTTATTEYYRQQRATQRVGDETA